MSLRVLLADENLAVQKLVELTLQNEGIHVVSSDNSLSALDIALKRAPDLILADFNLSGMDIFSFVQKIRQTSRLSDVPIILLINATETFDPAQLSSAGVQAFFKKPIDSQELLEEIKKLTGKTVQHSDESISEPEKAESAAEATEQHFFAENSEAGKMEAALGWSSTEEPEPSETFTDEQTVVSPSLSSFSETHLNESESFPFKSPYFDETIQKQVQASIEKVTANVLPEILKSALSKEMMAPILEKVAEEVVIPIAEAEVKKEIARLQTER